MASYLTASAFAGAMIMNVALALGLVRAVFGPSFMNRGIGGVLGIGGVAIFLTAAYMFLLQDERYYGLLDRFRSRPSPYRRRATIVTWSYVAVSYLAPLLFFIAMAATDE